MNRLFRFTLVLVLSVAAGPIITPTTLHAVPNRKLTNNLRKLDLLRKKLVRREHAETDKESFKNDWIKYSAKVVREGGTQPEPWQTIEAQVKWQTPAQQAKRYMNKLLKLHKTLSSGKEYSQEQVDQYKKSYIKAYNKVIRLKADPAPYTAEPPNNVRIVTPEQAAAKYLKKCSAIYKKMQSGKGYPQDTIDQYMRSYNKAAKKVMSLKASLGGLPQRLTKDNIKVQAISNAELAKRYTDKMTKIMNKLKMDGKLTAIEQPKYKAAYIKARSKAVKLDPTVAERFPADPPMGEPEDVRERIKPLRDKLDLIRNKLGRSDKQMLQDEVDNLIASYKKAYKKLLGLDKEIASLYTPEPKVAVSIVKDNMVSRGLAIRKMVNKLKAINEEVAGGVTKAQYDQLRQSFDKTMLRIKKLDPAARPKPDHILPMKEEDFVSAADSAKKYLAQIKAIDAKLAQMGSIAKWTKQLTGDLDKLKNKRAKLVRVIVKLNKEAAAAGQEAVKIPELPEIGAKSGSKKEMAKDEVKELDKQILAAAADGNEVLVNELKARRKKAKEKSKSWWKKIGDDDDDDDDKKRVGSAAPMGGAMGGGMAGGAMGSSMAQPAPAPVVAPTTAPAAATDTPAPAAALSPEEQAAKDERLAQLKSISQGDNQDDEVYGGQDDDQDNEYAEDDESGLSPELQAIANGDTLGGGDDFSGTDFAQIDEDDDGTSGWFSSHDNSLQKIAGGQITTNKAGPAGGSDGGYNTPAKAATYQTGVDPNSQPEDSGWGDIDQQGWSDQAIDVGGAGW